MLTDIVATRLDVSIPSRRVGDIQREVMREATKQGFHPLKAGRRHCPIVHGVTFVGRFHPLKAGRRRWICLVSGVILLGFHPLKAGRRPLGF